MADRYAFMVSREAAEGCPCVARELCRVLGKGLRAEVPSVAEGYGGQAAEGCVLSFDETYEPKCCIAAPMSS